MSTQLIILDRDGVINEDSPLFIKTVDEFIPIDGSIKAIAKIKKRGLLVAIASNQSGIARGLFTRETLNDMHAKLTQLLRQENAILDYLAICPHGPDEGCSCRKPKPGLLHEICQALHIKPEEAIFVGDSFRDYEAAHAINMPFALVLTGKGEEALTKHAELRKVPIYKNLANFANHL